MGLPASEQFVLSAIESELQTTDPELAIAFASFTSVTHRASMPVTEQLGTVLPPAGARTSGAGEGLAWKFVLVLAMLFIVGALLAAGTVMAFQGRHQNGTGCQAGYCCHNTGIQAGGPAGHGCAGTSSEQSQHSGH